MLAIIFGCEGFHNYLYGQRETTVENDHKPLKAILQKPIPQAPLCLKKMILRLKPYVVNVKYIPGGQAGESKTESTRSPSWCVAGTEEALTL